MIAGHAQRKYYDADSFELHLSKRSYEVHQVQASRENDYGQSILVGLTLYTDQTTGIVTTDIAAFEKHMGES